MAKEEVLEFPGTVTELLPNATFRIKLENEHEIIAHTAGRMRKNRIRVSDRRQGAGRDDALRPHQGSHHLSLQVNGRSAMDAFPILVLASGSPRRLELLNQAGIDPDRLLPADLDETPERNEHPRSLAKRLSSAKARVALRTLKGLDAGAAYVLAADTVVSVGREVMPKAELADDAIANLRTLSGRTHRVYTGVCLIGPNGALRQRLVETRVRFKRLSREDIDSYMASQEWRGKAGGYAIQGRAGSFVVRLVGSYTNVVGLPLYETLALLAGEGYDVHRRWKTNDGAAGAPASVEDGQSQGEIGGACEARDETAGEGKDKDAA